MIDKNCMITLTIFSEDPNLITYMANDYMYRVCQKIGYKVNRITAGKHVEANRPHWHIMYDVNVHKGKVYKTLNQTLIRNGESVMDDCRISSKKEVADVFRDTEIKISFVYDGQEKRKGKKVIVYGKSYMRYPFKEYNSFDRIDLDLQHGFNDEELEVLRKQSHQEWLVVKEKQQREIAQQIAEKDEYLELGKYLDDALSVHKNSVSSVELIRRCMVSIWAFKKAQHSKGKCRSIRVGSVQDQAMSWLVFNNYISEDEIVSMTIRI